MKKSINGPLGRSSVELLNSVKKKKSIVDKLAKFFSNKFHNLIKEKNYPITNLEKLITNFFETFEHNKTNEHDFIIGELEKQLLESINDQAINNNESYVNNNNNSKNKTNENFYDKNNDHLYNNDIINKNLKHSVINVNHKNIQNEKINNNDGNNKNANIFFSNESLEKNEKDKAGSIPIIHHQRSHSTNVNKDLPLLFYANDKLTNLREKANDEWALIAKFNHLKQLEDDKQRKFMKEEKQKKFKESLYTQLIEKDMFKKIKQEEDWQFFLRQNDKLQSFQNEELRRKKEKQDFIKAEKEFQDKIVSGSFFLSKNLKILIIFS